MNLKKIIELGLDRKVNDFCDFPEGLVLNVGAGNKMIDDSVPIDYPAWDADKDSLPFEDGSVSGIHCYHFLEHVASPVKTLLDFQRVLKKGGIVNVLVPYYRSQMAIQDLDHKSMWCEETWKILFNNPYYNKNRIEWEFDVNVNIIIGIVDRNLSLFTQLIRR